MEKLAAIGLLVIIAGFALIIAGAGAQENVSTGGVIFIGPFPIVFGSGPSGWPLALFSLAIGVVIVAFMLVWGIQYSRPRRE
jgi:uncharacterized membrane protein